MNRPEYVDLVTCAVHRAGRPEIARADTMFAAMDDPSGLRLTLADGREMLFRTLVTTAGRPQIAPRPPTHPAGGPSHSSPG